MTRTGITCYLKRTIRNKKGVIEFQDISRAHSFTKNFGYLLMHGFDQVSNTDYRDSGNNARTAAYVIGGGNYFSGMNIVAPAGNITQGIVVGSSNTAFTVNDYTLGSLILNGNSSGQLAYSAQLLNSPTVSGSDILVSLSRDIANNSGAQITVREVGLFGYPVCAGAPNRYTILFLRDIVADTPIDTGKVLNVTYTLKTTVV